MYGFGLEDSDFAAEGGEFLSGVHWKVRIEKRVVFGGEERVDSNIYRQEKLVVYFSIYYYPLNLS